MSAYAATRMPRGALKRRRAPVRQGPATRARRRSSKRRFPAVGRSRARPMRCRWPSNRSRRPARARPSQHRPGRTLARRVLDSVRGSPYLHREAAAGADVCRRRAVDLGGSDERARAHRGDGPAGGPPRARSADARDAFRRAVCARHAAPRSLSDTRLWSVRRRPGADEAFGTARLPSQSELLAQGGRRIGDAVPRRDRACRRNLPKGNSRTSRTARSRSKTSRR